MHKRIFATPLMALAHVAAAFESMFSPQLQTADGLAPTHADRVFANMKKFGIQDDGARNDTLIAEITGQHTDQHVVQRGSDDHLFGGQQRSDHGDGSGNYTPMIHGGQDASTFGEQRRC